MPRLRTLFGLGIVAGCTLALQVVITRLFSSVLAYHFGFLAISLALLGTGTGALWVYVRPAHFRGAPLASVLVRWSALFSLALLIVPFLLVRIDFAAGREALSAAFALRLALACALTALPSFAAGIVVTLTISRFGESIGLVYAFDLIGAGIGALVIVPVLWLAPAPELILWLGALAAVSTILFASDGPGKNWIGLGLLGGAAFAVWISATTSLLYLDPRYGISPKIEKVAEHWTPLTRVLGYKFAPGVPFASIYYDRVYAPVPVIQEGQLPTWKTLGTGPQSIGYELIEPRRVLVIGGGGGRDIYNALAYGQSQVDVIELNEGIRMMVDDDMASISGSPYSRDRVSTTVGDGRSVLAARDTLYDSIHIGFTDTLSANAAQGFALTENNLYTLEAFDLYFDHLAPEGILNVSRQLRLVGDEALRITVLTLAALRDRGIDNPLEHVVVLKGVDILFEPYGTVLARLRPFTSEELQRIEVLAQERGEGVLFGPLVFDSDGGPDPGEWKEDGWKALAQAGSLEEFCNSHSLNVCPPTDDSPFFFSMRRLSDIGSPDERYHYAADPISILSSTLVILLVLSGLGFVLPLAAVEASERPRLSALSFFAAIGLGFMLLEIVLIQRFVLFLGYPTYALSVVLAALLLWSGVGSAISTRWATSPKALQRALLAAVLLIGGSSFFLSELLEMAIGLPFAVRVATALLLIAPFGLTLGVAMPLGLRRFERLYPHGVPYAWAVNGIASVLASVLGIFIAIHFGFIVESLVACACYGFAAAHAFWGRWPEAA